jgi:hypothetical protein
MARKSLIAMVGWIMAAMGLALMLQAGVPLFADPPPNCSYDIADGPGLPCTHLTGPSCSTWDNAPGLCPSGTQLEKKTDFPQYCLATGLPKSCLLLEKDCWRTHHCQYNQMTNKCTPDVNPNEPWFPAEKKVTVDCVLPGGGDA